LSTAEHWIKPKPASFGPDAAQLLFRIENGMLKPGREYQPRIIVKTDDCVLHPQIQFKKRWPWIILEVAVVIAVIGFMAMVK
jgi:hypothetical protein